MSCCDAGSVKAAVDRAAHETALRHKRNFLTFGEPSGIGCLDTNQVVINDKLHCLDGFVFAVEHHMNVIAGLDLSNIDQWAHLFEKRVGRRRLDSETFEHAEQSVPGAQSDADT